MNMKTITINEMHQVKHELPAKAIGEWKIENVSGDIVSLHRVNKDGSLGSDRPHNIYKISPELLDAIAPEPKKPETPKAEAFEISLRKQRWIDQLIEQMESDPFLKEMLETQGRKTVIAQIIKDTDPNRQGGKAYSSISTALKIWNGRRLKGHL